MTDRSDITGHNRSDAVLSVMQPVTIVVTTIILILAIAGVWAGFNTNSTARQIRDSREAADCRDQYRFDIDEALGRLMEAKSSLDVLTAAGLEATVAEDDAALAAVLEDYPPARADVLLKIEDLEEAVQAAEAAAALSTNDPEGFLKQCRE